MHADYRGASGLEVLQWVADGCPDGVWQDFAYKHTAYALAERRLMTVDQRRGSWRAAVTDGGRFYGAWEVPGG